LFCVSLGATSAAQSVRKSDDSDWWSMLNPNFHWINVKPRQEEMDARNFTVAGVGLDRDQTESIEANLGKAKSVQRGDGAAAREQVCYVSEGPERVHLIFEFGEVDSIFYLFINGSDWQGSALCVKSKQVSMNLTTGSGLKLGLTRSQVETTLGKPDFSDDDRLVYFREIGKRTTPEEFERMRKEYPEKLSDKAAHEMFDSYTLQTYVEARFSESRLSYLAISTSSTN